MYNKKNLGTPVSGRFSEVILCFNNWELDLKIVVVTEEAELGFDCITFFPNYRFTTLLTISLIK